MPSNNPSKPFPSPSVANYVRLQNPSASSTAPSDDEIVEAILGDNHEMMRRWRTGATASDYAEPIARLRALFRAPSEGKP